MLRHDLNEIEKRLEAWAIILNGSVGIRDSPEEPSAEPRMSNDEARRSTRQSVTTIAKKIMHEMGTAGFEPRDITQGLIREGLNVHLTVGSNVIHRMKARGEVLIHNGRYYLPEYAASLIAENAMNRAVKMLEDQQQTPP